jgi:hypothetical protein
MDLTAILYNVNYPAGLSGLEIKPGAVFRDQYNETLDSATIIISQRTSQLLIEPFDIMVVSGSNFTTRRFAVNTITEKIISFDPLIYEYQIDLFSETKILENYLCPNLSITQPANENERKSIGFYLGKYVSLYGGKIRVRKPFPNIDEWEWANKFSVNGSLLTYFNGIICPELQWSAPTLREVLTDLMMVDDRIPILRGNEILALDISQKGSQIATTNLNLAQRMISSGDAVSELRLNLENAIDKKKDGADTVIKKVEYQSFRTSQGVYVNTTNMELVVNNPIYNLIRVSVMLPLLNTELSVYQWTDVDITEHIVEQGIYNLLSPIPVDLGSTYSYNPDYKNYKQFNAFYQRGGNTMSGWGNAFTTNQFFWITWDEFAIESIIRFAISNNSLPASFNYMDLVFRIEYETVASVLLDVGRTYDVKYNERVVFDNQSNSYVDVSAQGNFTQTKVNRLGNDVMMISGRYPTEVSVPVLPSLFGSDRVIFSREISVFQDFCNVTFMAAKNYVLQDYFVGVQSRKRNFELAGESSFLRHDLKKVYAEFSFVPKFDKKLTLLSTEKFDALYLSSLKRDDAEPLILGVGKTEDPYSATVYPAGDEYIALELDKKVTANSLIFTISFGDSYSAGDKIEMRSISYISSDLIRTLEVVPYANENNGEFDRLNVWFLKEYDPGDGIMTFPFNGKETATGSIASEITAYNLRHRSRPLVRNIVGNDAPIILDLPIYKDNKEIVKVTNQVEYCSDTRDIVFTERYLRLLKPVREERFPEYRYIAVGESAFGSQINFFNGSPDLGSGQEDKDPVGFIGKSIFFGELLIGGITQEFVSELINGNAVWEEYFGDFPTPVNDGSGNFIFTGSGSAYTAIHKLGEEYGIWARPPANSDAFFVKFDGTGVWADANDDFYQLAVLTVENTAGVPSLTASSVKGFMAVTFDGSNYRAWFSLPIPNFNSLGVFQSATWGWVEKSTVINDLFDIDRIYLYNGFRYKWNGTAWSQLVSTELPDGYKVYRSTSEIYSEYDTLPKGSEYVNASVVFESINNSTARIRLVSALGLPYVSWGIVDENGQLLIGVNGVERNIYINILRKRDTRVFQDDNGLTIVGSINDTLNDEYAV